MIQQQSKLCTGAMKLLQWPAFARSVSKSLWPACTRERVAIRHSSTVTHIQQTTEKEDGKTSNEGDASTQTQVQTKASVKVEKYEPQRAVLDAVMKVKTLTEAMEISKTFNANQRLQTLKNLVVAKVRPLPLIQTLTRSLSTSTEELDLKQLSDVLFVMAKLHYMDADVLSKTCDAMRAKVKQSSTPAVLGSSIMSLRKLQWKDPDLLDECSSWIQANYRTFDNPTNFIYTLALQNHSPPNLDVLLETIWKDLESSKYGPQSVINFLWSINVLNCSFPNDRARKALDAFFQPKFLHNLNSNHINIPIWIQLWNLHAIAKASWGQTDFVVPDSVQNVIQKIVEKNSKAAMVSEVTQLLFKELNANLYSTQVPTQMGFPIGKFSSLKFYM
ncbi:hypothetical protein ONE63_003770 [Megalurothrips usitatus]|uniref:Uncharacterized protein n=1 Tax=Megalurothrips usitatus TaxID=439358 RepID=A0AAV7X7Z3_9NEOP|nr:hypothetical protein ONE63_003770 [Megalurothrips usitatus]